MKLYNEIQKTLSSGRCISLKRLGKGNKITILIEDFKLGEKIQSDTCDLSVPAYPDLALEFAIADMNKKLDS